MDFKKEFFRSSSQGDGGDQPLKELVGVYTSFEPRFPCGYAANSDSEPSARLSPVGPEQESQYATCDQ